MGWFKARLNSPILSRGGLCIVCLVGLSGCTLFRSTGYKMPDLPTLPEPSAELQEAERVALQYGEDVLGLVAQKGAQPAQPLVQQGQEAVRAGRARLGEPAEPIPLPPITARNEEMDRRLEEIGTGLLDYRKGEVDWRRDYGRARGEPLEKETVIGGLSPWTVALIALAVAGAVVLLVKLPAVLVWVASVWKQARAAREIIAGVQEFKNKNATVETRRILGEKLDKNTSETTKAVIREVKKEEGLT